MKTPISSIGEFGLIDQIKEWTKFENPDLLKSIGDDSAVFHPTENAEQLITTDILVEGIHFDLTYQSMKHLGYKSVTVNLSDIYAMNGTPHYVTIALALPQKISVELIEEFYSGVMLACKEFHVAVVGGDLSASSGNMFISITAVGSANKESIVYRSNARPGDLVVVTGGLGRSFAGLKILIREKEFFLADPENYKPGLDNYSYVIERHLAPKPRKEVIRWLESKNILPTSMIDLSDGLVSDLSHICKQSKVSAFIDETKLPLTTHVHQVAELFSEDVVNYALYGGEDYELLFTVSPKFESLIESFDDLTIIGEIEKENPGQVFMRNSDGSEEELKPNGWKHF